jgi:two-component system, OmpR family, response regulator MtrA
MDIIGNVLIIDDEANLRRTLTLILQKAGCNATSAVDGIQALRMLADSAYDLVYLDLHLPGADGIQVLKEIRQQHPDLPVILLTGYGSMNSAVEALRLGALDYLLKPFDPDILVARTRVVLREQSVERRKRELREQIAALQAELQTLENGGPPQPVPTVPSPEARNRFLKVGRLILDLHAGRAMLGERVLDLTPAAFDYLAILARRSPDVVDYQTLVTEAQGYQVDAVSARELAKWHVHALRQVLETDPQNPRHILNVRGTGYRLLLDT